MNVAGQRQISSAPSCNGCHPLTRRYPNGKGTAGHARIRKALRKTRGHVGKCAKLSGLSRRSITDKIAHYKIDKSTFKKDEE